MNEIQTHLKPQLGWRNILVPVDLCEPSKCSLKIAAGLAKQSGAKLTLLHIVHVPTSYPLDVLQDVDDVMNSARDSLEKMCGAISPALIQQKIVRFGMKEIFQEIVETAQDIPADLIVIASHGHNRLVRALMGSIADKVIRHAPCTVLVASDEKKWHIAEPLGPFKKVA
jgi:nucleotide-binding universal stress UspA family protein